MKTNKYVILSGMVSMMMVSALSYAERVAFITIEDVGSGGAAAYNPTLDGLRGDFSFANNYSVLPIINPFTTDVAPIDTSKANPVDSFSSGFPFPPGSPVTFKPHTTGPIIADISGPSATPSLSILSDISALPFGGVFNGLTFELSPQLVDPTTLPGGECATNNPYKKLEVFWVNRVNEEDRYRYAMTWTHCITEIGDFWTFVAGWYLEGYMTVEDTVAPVLKSGVPDITGGDELPVGLKTTVVFNEPMNTSTVTTSSFLVYPTSGTIADTVCTSINIVDSKTFECVGTLSIGVNYTVDLTAAIEDDTAIPADRTPYTFAGTSYTFNAIANELIAPLIDSISPADGSTNFPANGGSIEVVFNEPMSLATKDAITLVNNGTAAEIDIVVTANKTFAVTPVRNLKNNVSYVLSIGGADSTGSIAKDISLNELVATQSVTFSTEVVTSLVDQGATVAITDGPGASMVSLEFLTAAQAYTGELGRIELDDNFVNYTVNSVSGGHVTVSIEFPNAIASKDLFKVVNGTLTKLVQGTGFDQYQRVNDTTITMTITDNGPNDSEVTLLNTITDPIGSGTDTGAKLKPGSLGGGWWLLIGMPVLLVMRKRRN